MAAGHRAAPARRRAVRVGRACDRRRRDHRRRDRALSHRRRDECDRCGDHRQFRGHRPERPDAGLLRPRRLARPDPPEAQRLQHPAGRPEDPLLASVSRSNQTSVWTGCAWSRESTRSGCAATSAVRSAAIRRTRSTSTSRRTPTTRSATAGSRTTATAAASCRRWRWWCTRRATTTAAGTIAAEATTRRSTRWALGAHRSTSTCGWTATPTAPSCARPPAVTPPTTGTGLPSRPRTRWTASASRRPRRPATWSSSNNSTLNHYFMTISAAEAAGIDNGSAGPGGRAPASSSPAGPTPIRRR